MRRLLASLLLASIGLPVVASALALTQDDSTRLPACCRRNGAHHCARMAAALDARHTGAPIVSAICASYTQPTATAPSAVSAAYAAPATIARLYLVTTTVFRRIETKRLLYTEHPHHKRGPPVCAL